jgi:hypothetical protein
MARKTSRWDAADSLETKEDMANLAASWQRASPRSSKTRSRAACGYIYTSPSIPLSRGIDESLKKVRTYWYITLRPSLAQGRP